MFAVKFPALHQVNADGIEIDPPKHETDSALIFANWLFLSVDHRCNVYRNKLLRDDISSRHALGLIANDAIIDAITATHGKMDFFECSMDTRKYPILGYHLHVKDCKYLLEAAMHFDCEVKFDWWGKLKVALGRTAYPKFIGNFEYEFKLWYDPTTYYSIRVPYRKFSINDTYFINGMRRYIGIPSEYYKDLHSYSRRKYEQRNRYFSGDHC